MLNLTLALSIKYDYVHLYLMNIHTHLNSTSQKFNSCANCDTRFRYYTKRNIRIFVQCSDINGQLRCLYIITLARCCVAKYCRNWYWKVCILNTFKPVLAATSFKQPTCLKHQNKMFPNVKFVLIFTSIKQPLVISSPFVCFPCVAA